MPVFSAAGTPDTKNATVIWNRAVDSPFIGSSSAAVGYPSINVLDPATFSSWKPTTSGAWIRFDFGSATLIDGVGIGAHNLATSGVSSVAIQSSPDATTWTTRVSMNTLTNEDLMGIFPAVSARYWRVFINGPAANIGCIAFGKRLIFPHAPIDGYTPLRHTRQYTKLFNNSIGGQLLGNRVMAAGASTTVDFGFVPVTFVDNELPEFGSHYAQGGTFFYAACPRDLPREMGYCWAISEESVIDVSYIEGGKLSNMSFGVNSYVAA